MTPPLQQWQNSLVTNRLVLDPLHINDGEFILSLVNTEGWLKLIGDRNVHSISDAETYIQDIIANPGILYWVARTKSQNNPIGVITLIKRKDLPHPDLGFAFLPAYANKGYAFEACGTVLDHILADGITFLNAITNEENKASIRLLEKFGFGLLDQRKEQDNVVHIYGASADKIAISQVVNTFFSVFTNRYGQPCLDILAGICLPEALIIRKQPAAADVMGLSAFITPREKLLTDGTLLKFEEKEVFEETRIIGDIAQRYSKYKKKGILT